MIPKKKYSFKKPCPYIGTVFVTTEFSTNSLSDKYFKKKLFLKSIIIILFLSFPLFSKFIPKNKRIHFSNYTSIKNPIKVAFYNNCLRYGGIERVTSILLNYFSKEKFFTFYLITISGVLDGEYSIPKNIERISLQNHTDKLIRIIYKKKLDILIYNLDGSNEIKKLNKLRKTKVIYCIHSSFFYRIYEHSYSLEKTVYKAYKNCKYVFALIPLENDYLFKKWGINSILMENPSTFDFNLVIPSDLSQKNIIMIGRGDYHAKRFELGIKAMKFILQEIPECKMNIISFPYKNLEDSINYLNLKASIKISGFQKNPESYLKNSSLHIFPSLSEAYPMTLGEVKIFGIPSILCGLDYTILSEGGTVIIYDDNPETIAKEAIRILKDDKYRKRLGKEARESMKKYKNEYIVKKWKKVLLNVYNDIDASSFARLFSDNRNKITEKKAYIILNNQLELLKKRIPRLSKLTIQKLISYSLE